MPDSLNVNGSLKTTVETCTSSPCVTPSILLAPGLDRGVLSTRLAPTPGDIGERSSTNSPSNNAPGETASKLVVASCIARTWQSRRSEASIPSKEISCGRSRSGAGESSHCWTSSSSQWHGSLPRTLSKSVTLLCIVEVFGMSSNSLSISLAHRIVFASIPRRTQSSISCCKASGLLAFEWLPAVLISSSSLIKLSFLLPDSSQD
mmetsp:Transcript_38870/g.61428  ORF Transcript_38870/g.61428 Transcript_38870/m.61428 type:complete len:205 (-) Transcript_38870:670-1284(-)